MFHSLCCFKDPDIVNLALLTGMVKAEMRQKAPGVLL